MISLGGPLGSDGIFGNSLQDKLNQLLANAPKPPALIDPNSLESITPEFDKRMAAINGPGQWTQMRLAAANKEQQMMTNQARAQAATNAAMARSQLASKGGLTSGAAERTANAAGLGSLQAQQQAASEGGLNRLNIMGEGAKAQQAFDTQKVNSWAQLAAADADRKNQLRMANQQMLGQIYGSNATAQATRDANKKSGLFGGNIINGLL